MRVLRTLIRVLWCPYEGYQSTLIRVLGTLIRVPNTLIRVLGTLIRVPGTLIRVLRYP
ncbi:hypothetical protein PCANC_28373 [Puccinia coronata f. sp. avenae]|uniref:Uncharacterized protein n=1 Tax=Puccinia coronata f. sp. avenae TaxID=200324 RepID=A0A2N5RYA4_9BASI|nr:hypothetical protein PCANC_28373 [Puccinia coronata f. sp. avenae]